MDCKMWEMQPKFLYFARPLKISQFQTILSTVTYQWRLLILHHFDINLVEIYPTRQGDVVNSVIQVIPFPDPWVRIPFPSHVQNCRNTVFGCDRRRHRAFYAVQQGYSLLVVFQIYFCFSKLHWWRIHQTDVLKSNYQMRAFWNRFGSRFAAEFYFTSNFNHCVVLYVAFPGSIPGFVASVERKRNMLSSWEDTIQSSQVDLSPKSEVWWCIRLLQRWRHYLSWVDRRGGGSEGMLPQKFWKIEVA